MKAFLWLVLSLLSFNAFAERNITEYLIKENLLYWEELLERETLQKIEEWKKKHSRQKSELLLDTRNYLDEIISLKRRDLRLSHTSSNDKVKLATEVAILYYFYKKETKRAISVLKKYTNLSKRTNSPAHNRARIFLAAIYLNTQQQDKAIQTLLGMKIWEEEMKFRRLTIEGDAHFKVGDYNAAHDLFTQAMRIWVGFSKKEQAKKRETLSALVLRLLWSSFRDGDYTAATHWALEVVKSYPLLVKYYNKKMEADIIRIAGISLYELQKLEAVQKFVDITTSGEVPYWSISEAMKNLRKHKLPHLIIKWKEGIKNNTRFTKSIAYLDISNRYLQTLYDQKSDKIWAIIIKVLTHFRNGGYWSLKYRSLKPVEKQRRAFVFRWGRKALAYYEIRKAKGFSVQKKIDRIVEVLTMETMSDALRAVFVIKKASFAFQRQKYKAAFQFALSARKLPHNEFEEQNILKILTESSLELGLQGNRYFKRKAWAISEEALERYPHRKDFRALYYTVTHRLASAEQDRASIIRYFHLLSLLKNAKGSYLQKERSKVLEGLISRIFSSEEPLQYEIFLSQIMDIYPKNGLPFRARQGLWHAQEALIRQRRFQNLAAGSLQQNLMETVGWLRLNKKNPRAPYIVHTVMEDAVYYGSWSHVQKILEEAKDIKMKGYKFYPEVSYWKGRAYEGLLQFKQAADTYSQITVNSKKLSKHFIEDALLRGFRIYSDLSFKDKRAVLSEKLAFFYRKQSKGKWRKYLLLAIDDYQEVNRHRKALSLVKRLPQKFTEVKIARLKSELVSPKRHQSARERLHRLQRRLQKKPGVSSFFNEATLILNREVAKELRQMKLIRGDKPHLPSFKRLAHLIKKQESRLNSIDSPAVYNEAAAVLKESLKKAKEAWWVRAQFEKKLSEKKYNASLLQSTAYGLKVKRLRQKQEPSRLSFQETLQWLNVTPQTWLGDSLVEKL